MPSGVLNARRFVPVIDWIVDMAPTKRFDVRPSAHRSLDIRPEAPFEHVLSIAGLHRGGAMTVGGVTVEEWGSAFPYACEKTGAIAYARNGSASADSRAFDSGGPVDGAPPEWSNPAVTPLSRNVGVFVRDRQADSHEHQRSR